MCNDALHLGLSQEEYERALHRQLDADMERASQQPSSHGVVIPPQVIQQDTLSKPAGPKAHSSDKRDDTKEKADSRDEYTTTRLPLPWGEDDSGLATCTDEQSGQQAAERSDAIETLEDQQHTRSGGREKLLGDVHHAQTPAATADPVTVTWRTASEQRPSEHAQFTAQTAIPAEETRSQEEDELTPIASLSTSSSAAQHFNEIVQAAPEAFSIALSTVQQQLQEEMKKKDELEKGYKSLATQSSSACSVLFLEGIQASEKRLAVLQEKMEHWKRLSVVASRLTRQKEGNRVP